MSIRETIISNPRASGSVAIGLVALAGILIFTQLRPPAPKIAVAANQAFYTIDDGETWFADSTPKVVPFSHDGKSAVQAFVFRPESGGAPFVGYLMRYSEAGLVKLTRQEKEREAALKGLKSVPGGYNPNSGIPVPAVTYEDMTLQEVKRPKTKGDWIARLNPAGIDLVNVKSPDGAAVVPVEP